MNASEAAITTTQLTDLIIPDPGERLDQNPAAVFLASKKPNSRRVYESDLATIAGMLTGDPDPLACNWAALRYQYTAAIQAQLQQTISDRTGEPLAPSTINRMLCALRGVLKEAWRLGLMSAEDYHKARDVQSVKGETLPAGRELSPGEVDALARACGNDITPAGARDNAIIALGYACGLRRAELVTLDLSDCEYRPESEDYKLVVRGKRNKERTAYPRNGAAKALSDWLKIRGDEPGPLFMAINKGGKIRDGRLTTQAIYNMLKKRATEAGVDDFSPHDMRRTFVSDLLDAGADIATVAKMAGHASVNTTARYDRRPEKAKQKAAGLLHYPNYRTVMV